MPLHPDSTGFHALLTALLLGGLAAPAMLGAGSTTPPPAIESVSPAFKDAAALKVTPLRQDYTAKSGETQHTFTFQVTNISTEEVVIFAANTSCGCSVASMPDKPWVLAPGQGGAVEVAVDLTGKYGVLSKVATLDTVDGRKVLAMTLHLPEAANESDERRKTNLQLASANRQAVFKGECASCHALPTIGLRGAALYAAACGICHEAENRATMVPDLSARTFPAEREYWVNLITAGKPGTLMPAFGQNEGGPLDAGQINSLVDYLFKLHAAAPSR